MSTAALGEDYIVKFAWSRAAARFVLHQIRILEVLAVEPAVPCLPEVVAAGTSPLILITRRVRGTSASGHEKMQMCGQLAPGSRPSFLQSCGHWQSRWLALFSAGVRRVVMLAVPPVWMGFG
jgi:hypothetical protein